MTSPRPMKPDRAPADTLDREIVVSRVFDASRALVFKAWTDPQFSALEGLEQTIGRLGEYVTQMKRAASNER
jgi:hypothetical protein